MNPKRWFGLCMAALALGGCGGGDSGGNGSGVLYVSVSYSGEAYLLHSSSIVPQLSGFEGHSPQCSLGSGRLPAGMSLNGDCSISGIPTEAGVFDFIVHIGASGVSNQLDWQVGFAVFGPSVLYPEVSDLAVGSAVDIAPLNIFWQPNPGETVTYSIARGDLPAGLSINPRNGRITGTISAAGSYAYQLRADVASAGLTGFVVQQGVSNLNVYVPSALGYPDGVGPWVGVPVDVMPRLPALPGVATYDFELIPESAGDALPPGLAFDPLSGRLFGTPTEPSLSRWVWRINQHFGGQVQASHGELQFALRYPINIGYADCVQTQPCLSAPAITPADPDFAEATFAFALDPGSLLSPGLQLDPVSGVISGVPETAWCTPCIMRVTVRRNGSIFVMPVNFYIRSL